jgi:hypothetical protein
LTEVQSIFLETNHLFLRDPQGGSFNIVDMKNAGFGAIFCNIGDHAPSEWTEIRQRAKEANVICGPWLRTADVNNNFSYDKLDYLIDISDDWNTPLIVNSESEIKGSGDTLTNHIAAELRERDAAISMECWPFANVSWWPLGRYPFLPQIFPAEAEAAKNPEACRQEWHAYGIECVVFTFGSYHDMMPDDFDLLSPYGVYTADDCGGDFQAWASRGTHNPCLSDTPEPPEDLVEKIGTQHGISAMANIFREQWPDKTGKPDPNDHTTWKAIDKWERSQLMLVEAHDARQTET